SPTPWGLLLSHCLATAARVEQAMASSEAASSFLYETDDFTFEERSSLYELRLARQRENGKKSLLHRLIFLAKISPDLADKRDLAAYWEQLFTSLPSCGYQGEGVTGLLLLYPTYVVHILEASSDVLYSILRDLRDVEQQQRVLILDAKILIMSHNLPIRLFQQWNYKVLNMPGTQLGYDMPHEEPAEAIVCECLAVLLKLGMHLQKYPKSPKNLPDTILEKVPELIVPQGTICYLLECQELLSPAEYLHLFDSPVDISTDSEIMWPLTERLKPRLEWVARKELYSS
ncbi:testis-expressed protein 47, partial [Varanus komodoensis]|uniref:testis-expressed protein 47 n=1 Tax=Varanus komodoensis TaxID=61221 RepID=UPI001CF7C37C